MKTVYDDGMTMREARRRYFEVNGFGETGGYDAAWVDFHIGPLPMPFPNTKGRVRALAHHDVHHILTDYDTNFTGELEIGAWEIGAGCRDFAAAWVLNLGAVAAGLLAAPRRVFRAFVRGRRDTSTYGTDPEAMLDLTVAEARARFMSAAEPKASLADVVLFAVMAAASALVGLTMLALGVPLVPIGLVMLNVLKRRATSTATA